MAENPNDSERKDSGSESRKSSRLLKTVSFVIRSVLLLTIVGATVIISRYWLLNRPVAERQKPRHEAVLVDIEPIVLGEEQVIIRTLGTVIPALKIQLAARVSGQITDVSPSFIPGGIFKEGEMMLQVDKRDYELALTQQEANLVRAESDVHIEMGQQSVAQKEYELLMENVEAPDLDLLLRKPQLASKEAAVDIAKSALDKAKLDLQRTVIAAPFNATVLSRTVDKGAYVAPGGSLATLVGTDMFWIEVSVPVNELSRINFPGPEKEYGSAARVCNSGAWGEAYYREGYVERLAPDLEPEGRMARLLVSVADPLLLKTKDDAAHALLLDSFVRVLIEGESVRDAARFSRTYLHDNNTIWIMREDNTLEIRKVSIAWSVEDEVFVSEGLHDGEQLVTSALAAPVEGMLLRTKSSEEKKTSGAEGETNS